MKYISIAPSTFDFAWQVDLAYHQHLALGMDISRFIVLSPYVNSIYDTYQKCFPSYIGEKNVDPFWEYLGIDYDGGLLPINIQTSLAQYEIEDEEVYVIGDADMFPIKNKHFDLASDICHETIYERWHIHQHTDGNYLKCLIPEEKRDFNFSGFVPIVIKGSVLKIILPDWIRLHLDAYKICKQEHKWWCGMYSYNLVCASHNLKIDEKRICVLPFDTEINDSMFYLHYSVAFENFDKHKRDFFLHKEKIINTDLQKLSKVEKIMFYALLNWYTCSEFSNHYL